MTRLLIIENIDLMTYEQEKELYRVLKKLNIEFQVFNKDIERSTCGLEGKVKL